MRLDKYVAKSIHVSRSEAKELIKEGRVKVNGKVIKNPEYKVKEGQKVEIEGKEIKPKEKIYIKLYKPKGYLSTTEEEAKYPSFFELLKDYFGSRKLFTAGRLDVDAEGLLIVTNDGELAHRIMHPKWKVEKEYIVELDKELKDEDIEKIKNLEIEGKKVKVEKVEKLNEKIVKIILTEGRYHIVKRIFRKLGYKTIELKRTRIGNIKLGEDMQPGDWQELTDEELRNLKTLVGLK